MLISEHNKLLELVESFRWKEHSCVEEDCFYSCPAHPDSCGSTDKTCNCGFDGHNAKVDEVLDIIRRIQPTVPQIAN